MAHRLAAALSRIGFSPTLEISAKARALSAEGVDVVDLSVGEPDFPTPENVRAAAKRAIDEERIGYTASEGMPALRKAIAAKFERDNGLTYDPKTEILVSSGVKNSLYHLFAALLDPGDEVVIPAPYWVSYPEMVKIVGGEPKIVETTEAEGFRLTPERLGRAIGPRTRAVVICNPGNPTGAAYDREELWAVANAAAERGILVVADEIYEKLQYDGRPFTSVAALSPRIRANTVVVNGVSKAYAMTGWRIGYAAGPAEIIEGMSRIQSHSLSNVCTVSQYATIEALSGPQDEIARMRAAFQRRRDFLYERLAAIPGVTCHPAEGAFYLFPNLSRFYDHPGRDGPIGDSVGMARHLLEEAHVAVVPGAAFGADAFVRLSYATSMDRLEAGVDRIAAALR